MSCLRTFNVLTGTPLARLRHKEKWLSYLKAIGDSMTIRKAAAVVGLNRKTSFRWRHRFFAWIAYDRPTSLHGITEANETYLFESYKGSHHLDRTARKREGSVSQRGLSREHVCILVARDRAGYTVDFVTGQCERLQPQNLFLTQMLFLLLMANLPIRPFARQKKSFRRS